MVDRDQAITVGRVRQQLGEFHESDIVLVCENNLLYKTRIFRTQTAAGTVVVIERGDKYQF